MHQPERHRLAEWIQKQGPYTCCLQETHFRPRDTFRLKVRGWKKIFHANGNQKKAGVAILISDKIDFKTKAIQKDTGLLNGYKNKAHIHAVYRRPTSDLGTHSD